MPKTSSDVRQEVGHPIIDADGHTLELIDATYPHLRESLGAQRFEHWRARGSRASLSQRARTSEERRDTRTPQGAWWGTQTVNVLDRATAILPALLHERMGEIGLDYAVLYPTNTLLTCAEEDPDLRQGLCAGFNAFSADVYGPFADRITAAGMIPMHTPEEAVAELYHCRELGLKVVALPEGVARPLKKTASDDCSPWLIPGQRQWFDSFGLDSLYDYDPVWATCQELGFAVTFHGGLTVRPGLHWSTSSYVANHVGQFAAEMYPLCKSLFFGGVTRRFPDLAFVFLECGVSWGMQLLADTIEHWEKRNLSALTMLDPSRLDRKALGRYFEQYGGRLAELLGGDPYEYVQNLAIHGSVPEQPDEFVHMAVSRPRDIVSLFTDSFYFGCEADDRGLVTAFLPSNPEGKELRPVFSSDMGHWDVTDIAGVVAESHHLVDDGHLTAAQWRRFVFDNPAEMFLRADPHFFDGTAVADHLPAGSSRT
jgi:predicted TIM-barrel fold metal-dependent hydrolase